MADCTPSVVLVPSRLCTIPFTLFISCRERETQIMHTAIPIRASVLPLESTGPVRALVIRGMIIPVIVTAMVAAMRISMSPGDTQSFIYRRRSGIPSAL